MARNNRARRKGAIGGIAMATKSLDPKAMESRVARFDKLQTYQTQNLAAQGIPPGAMEKITARKVYPVMAPADYRGRSAGAPVKGPRGLIVSIAECEPGNGPGLHRHLNTVENSCACPAVSRLPGAITASTRWCSIRST
jgi:hypothetical protein